MINDIEELLQEIINYYNKHPKGWRFVSDNKGNVIVIGPDVGYQLKLMMINPNESIGIGTKITNLESIKNIFKIEFDAGFRILDESALNTLISGKFSNNFILKLLEKEPSPLNELDKGKAILGGPFLLHPDIRMISKSQQKLEEKLTMELNKLFRMKYPHRANIYW
ncbi:MAG: hypothetical protein QXW62_03245 [Candidatus Methanomethylicaceae archaeon]|nr:hypothetical protein [Candidatus Verstraetearchaeota archaeon]